MRFQHTMTCSPGSDRCSSDGSALSLHAASNLACGTLQNDVLRDAESKVTEVVTSGSQSKNTLNESSSQIINSLVPYGSCETS